MSSPTWLCSRIRPTQGYGETEKTLLRYALGEEADVRIVLHPDGQYSPEKIVDLLDPFEWAIADLVQGSRVLGGGALRGGMPLYKFIAIRTAKLSGLN
jgi:hypothetical protein